MSFQLYSFGFNAFNQISGDNSSHLTVAKACHKHVDKVLFSSWETTIVLDGKEVHTFFFYLNS